MGSGTGKVVELSYDSVGGQFELSDDVNHRRTLITPFRETMETNGARMRGQLEELDSGVDVGEGDECVASRTEPRLATRSYARKHAFSIEWTAAELFASG